MYLQILFSFILFLFTIVVSFYIPGIFLASFLPKEIKKNSFFLSWPLGYSFFILVSYCSAWIRFPGFTLLFLVLTFLLVLIKKRNEILPRFDSISWSIVFLIFFGSLCFVGTSFFSAIKTANGLQFIGNVNASDGLLHLALIKTQTYIFPPVFPSFYDFSLRGYHYFYDFLLSRFALFYHFSPEDLYYRFFPLIISIFYGWSIYKFSMLLTLKKIQLFLILFFAYFSQSFAFLLSLIIRGIDSGNGMGVVQPLELILDPSAIFGIGLLLCGFYLLLQTKKTIAVAILSGFILGLLAQLKIYAGIIALGSLFFFSCFKFLKKENVNYYLIIFITTIFLTSITFLPNNLGMGKLLWHPFFLYDDFMKQSFFASWNWEIRMTIYSMHNNALRLILMNVLSAILLWVLALGTKSVFIFDFPKLFKKTFWENDIVLILSLAIAIPILIGSILIQSVSIFDTKQFFWIPAVLIGIPAGIFYGKIVSKIPIVWKIVVISLLIFCSWGALLGDENRYVFKPQPILISNNHLSFIKQIQNNVSKQNFFVVLPILTFDQHGRQIFQYYGGPLFSALTGTRTYYEFEYLAPEHVYTKERDRRKKQLELILLLGEQCKDREVASIMHSIGTNYMVSQSDFFCGSMKHLKKLDTKEGWTFWKAV